MRKLPTVRAAQGPRRLALQYMTQFQCLGGACEDCCCRDWTIHIDQPHYDKVRNALARDPAGPDPEVLKLRPPAERSGASFARMELRTDGTCPLLSADQLCDLHRAHGEAVLPDGCAMYPRAIKRSGTTLELSGELSCPEVVRLALLKDDDATRLVPLTQTAPLGRGVILRDSRSETSAAAAALDPLRGALYGLMDAPYPLHSRLFFTSYLASQLSEALAGATGGAAVLAAVEEARARLQDARLLTALHQRFEAGRREVQPALALVLGVVGTRVHHGSGAFHRLVGAVWESYAAEADGGVTVVQRSEERLQVELDAGRVLAAYQRRRARVEPVFLSLLDRALTHYARHYWIKEWYTESPSLMVHSQTLLLRLALLRFLLLSHPEALQAAAGGHHDGEGDEAALSRLLVTACYSFARVIDHNSGFAGALQAALLPLHRLGDAVALLLI